MNNCARQNAISSPEETGFDEVPKKLLRVGVLFEVKEKGSRTRLFKKLWLYFSLWDNDSDGNGEDDGDENENENDNAAR